jgi:hypothetical protein
VISTVRFADGGRSALAKYPFKQPFCNHWLTCNRHPNDVAAPPLIKLNSDGLIKFLQEDSPRPRTLTKNSLPAILMAPISGIDSTAFKNGLNAGIVFQPSSKNLF